MNFLSDNSGPAAPEVMAALAAANEGYAPGYGDDDWTARAVALIREAFEAPEAEIQFVTTGSAANALSLAVLARPWDAIFCHMLSHIEVDECGAPEFFTGGAKLRRIAGADAKIAPQILSGAIESVGQGDVHSVQRGPVSITQTTELGAAYSTAEIRALCDVAKGFGLGTHMDGARFSNAVAAIGCSPAEMSWKAGIDILSFGGTKNGCLGVEAVIAFDPETSWELALRRKRAGHLWSKHRYLGAQMAAYLENGLWLSLAGRANARMGEFLEGLRGIPEARLETEPTGNMVFFRLPRGMHRRAMAAGAQYKLYPEHLDMLEGAEDEPVLARVVCDWSKRPEDVAALLALWR